MLRSILRSVKLNIITVRPSRLTLLKSSGLIPFLYFFANQSLLGYLRDNLPDRRQLRKNDFLAHEIVIAVIVNFVAGVVRPWQHHGEMANYPLLKCKNGRVPHFGTLLRYVTRNADLLVQPLTDALSWWSCQIIRKETLNRNIRVLTLDIDQTAEFIYGRQEGAERGYNAEHRTEKCFQLAVWMIRELRLLVRLELRRGSSHCAKDLLSALKSVVPTLLETGVILRIFADSGYESTEVMEYLHRMGVKFMFVQKQRRKVKKAGRYARRLKSYVKYNASAKERATQVGECEFRQIYLQVHEAWDSETGQLYFKEFLPEEFTNVFVTNMESDWKKLYREYRGHAVIESVIEELKNEFAAAKSRTNELAANQAFTLLAGLAYNLKVRYMQKLNGNEAPIPKADTVRRYYLDIPGYMANHSGKVVLKVASYGFKRVSRAIQLVRNAA